MKQTLIIEGSLTDLNTYINAERTNRFIAAKIKKNETWRVAQECRASKLQPMQKVRLMTCYWFSPNERKDADNIEFGKKYICDGLVEAGILPDDSRKHTDSTIHNHYVDSKRPRVEVVLEGE